MRKTISYLKSSTNKQDLNNQKIEILEYSRKKDIKADEFIEITISSRKTNKQRRVDEVMEKLLGYDTLIVTEMSRLGRSIPEVITLVNELLQKNVRIVICKQNLDMSQQDMNSKIIVTLFSLFSELGRHLISLRIKEVLVAKKAQGIVLGKPKGAIQKSKFDKDVDRINELLGYGLSVRKIAKALGYTTHISLNNYINKRKIKESVTF